MDCPNKNCYHLEACPDCYTRVTKQLAEANGIISELEHISRCIHLDMSGKHKYTIQSDKLNKIMPRIKAYVNKLIQEQN